MKQPKPKPRVNSDSLMSKSQEKKYVANINAQVGRAQIKNNGGNVPLEYTQNGMPRKGPTGNERIQKAKELRQSASKDSLTAAQSKRMKSTKPAPAKPLTKVKSKSMPVKKSMSKSTK